MSDLVFYTNPQSRGLISHWMLEEVAEPYETVWLEYKTSIKSPEYLAINPMGKVPALTHLGSVITEAAAICTYLAAIFPEKNLIPARENPKLADYYRWMFFAAGPFEMAVTTHAHKWPVTEENSRSLGFGSYAETIDTIELAIATGPHICGEQFTAADVYVGMHLDFGMQFGNIAKRDSFEEYVSRLRLRPAHQRANQICEERTESVNH